ncbi:hotdog fold domain-containing protein [Streptosporangium sp. KLBMP 9127]|nr:hotdog fold thioesterase [Streptosporangium sp. KLBMP 9127]
MTTAAELQTVLRVPARFRGPAEAANGGWIAATVAEALGAEQGSAVEVTLHAPTPLEKELRIQHHGSAVTLADGDHVLVEAIPVAEDLPAPGFVPFNEAARAEEGFPGLAHHPFPECFVCGFRDPGDGLRILPGPVPGRGLYAAGWRVPASVTDGDGVVPDPIVWGALDCVSGWAGFRPGERALLGRLSARIHRRVYPGGTYSVVGRAAGREGRKMYGESAIYELDGTLVATSRATWIVPR